jgi:hypothetical protein
MKRVIVGLASALIAAAPNTEVSVGQWGEFDEETIGCPTIDQLLALHEDTTRNDFVGWMQHKREFRCIDVKRDEIGLKLDNGPAHNSLIDHIRLEDDRAY